MTYLGVGESEAITRLSNLLKHAKHQIKLLYEGGEQIHLVHALNDIIDILEELVTREGRVS